VGPRAFLDAVVKKKIPSPRRESNPRTPIIAAGGSGHFLSVTAMFCPHLVLDSGHTAGLIIFPDCQSDKFMALNFSIDYIY
jgi:hypothetical protein